MQWDQATGTPDPELAGNILTLTEKALKRTGDSPQEFSVWHLYLDLSSKPPFLKSLKSALERNRWAEYVFKIIQKTYSRIKIPGPDISLFESAYDILHPMNMSKFLVAFKNSEPIGALALLFHKKSAYAWYLGSYKKYFSVHPNHLLIWEGLKTAKQNGCTMFDFLGAGRPDEGVGRGIQGVL